MKKNIKRSLIGIGILIGFSLLIAGGFFLRFYLGIRDMAPAETSRLNDSVFCIRNNFVNAFVFKGKDGYLLIDAGRDEESMKMELNKLGIEPGQISNIILTHTDSDHIGAIHLFANSRIFLHKAEEQMINGQNGKMFFLRTKWKPGTYTLFNNNDSLILDGLKIKVFHTPGHTPGSCCFLVSNNYLVTGDNLAYKDGKFTHFTAFFNMDTKAQEVSVKTLPPLDSIKFILTAHYGIIKH